MIKTQTKILKFNQAIKTCSKNQIRAHYMILSLELIVMTAAVVIFPIWNLVTEYIFDTICIFIML